MKLPVFTKSPRSVIPLAGAIAAIAVAVVLASAGGHAAQGHEHARHAHHDHPRAAKHKPLNGEQLVLHDTMRKLWEDHITWTRLAIISFAADLPDFDETAQRLLANQDHIGAAFEPYYGSRAAARLTSLLKEHIAGAVDLLEAAKANNEAQFRQARDAWYRNGDEIAAFLNQANPRFWPLAAMQAMMRAHLDQTLEEAAARLNGDFDADIRAYEEIHQHILVMADTLTAGIVKQFPRRFR